MKKTITCVSLINFKLYRAYFYFKLHNFGDYFYFFHKVFFVNITLINVLINMVKTKKRLCNT
jgi:hypothetical protein